MIFMLAHKLSNRERYKYETLAENDSYLIMMGRKIYIKYERGTELLLSRQVNFWWL